MGKFNNLCYSLEITFANVNIDWYNLEKGK